MTQQSFSASLKHWRKLRGLSQLELAMRAGTTQRYVSSSSTAASAWPESGPSLKSSCHGGRIRGPDFVGFAVPLFLETDLGEARLVTTLTHFGTAADVAISELKLDAFLPADDETAELLRKLASR